jgi:glycosidase
MRLLIYTVFCTFAILGCTSREDKTSPDTKMQKTHNKLVIYQMMTRLFGNKVSENKFYGTITENGVGKFNDITVTALKSIRELGVTHVWYTGVLEHATLTDYSAFGIASDDADVVKGRAGSPYAIKDYYDVDPDLAVNVPNRMREFEELIARTHEQELKVIIDFIPNHVARTYHSDAHPPEVKDLGEEDNTSVAFERNNNFYYLPGQSFKPPFFEAPSGFHPSKDGRFEETPAKATGNDVFTASPDVNSWFETVKLNYGVDLQNNRAAHFDPIPNTWMKMRDILSFWARKKIDGFRCDMAEMVPVEFWAWVIPQIKEINPDIIFIAEIYNPSQYRNYIDAGRFDYLYDKVLLYDMLRLLVGGQRSTTEIDKIQKNLDGINGHMLHFMENHDEQRLSSNFFAGGPWRGFPAFVISATIDQGPVMIYFGQEVGEPALGAEGFQSDDGRTSIFDYWGVPEHQKWMNDGKFDGAKLSDEQKQLRRSYGELLSFVASSKAIGVGEYADITSSNQSSNNFPQQVHAFLRFYENERLLVLTSFNTDDLDVKVQIPREAFSKMGLDPDGVYIARDMLWREVEVGFDKDLSFSLHLKPFSSFIFKIK